MVMYGKKSGLYRLFNYCICDLDFCYGFSDWVASWQMWNWYLVILLITITSLLIIKYKQNQRKLALEQYAKENDRRRIQLSQLLLFEQLNQLNEELFSELLQRFFELEGL